MSTELDKYGSEESRQRYLYLVEKLYEKRDEILKSSERLVEYSYEIETCPESELDNLFSKIDKELPAIISHANELAPHLKNPNIVSVIATEAGRLTDQITIVRNASEQAKRLLRKKMGQRIRYFAQFVNRTQVSPTPKSIKMAYGIEIDIKKSTVKAFIERLTQYF
jgi:hypothetical protein